MPTYDYACKACGHAFEHFQPMGDKLLRTCPECGKRQLERLIGAGSGIVFKGSGFYETDYKRKADKPAGEGSAASKDGGSESDAKASTSKAAKPDEGGKGKAD